MLRCDGFPGQNRELLQVDGLVWIPQVEEFVTDPGPFSGGGLGGPDGHLAIELARIDAKHCQIKLFGQLQGQGCLAARSRAHQGDDEGGRGVGHLASLAAPLRGRIDGAIASRP